MIYLIYSSCIPIEKLFRHSRGNISIAKGIPIQNTNDIENKSCVFLGSQLNLIILCKNANDIPTRKIHAHVSYQIKIM